MNLPQELFINGERYTRSGATRLGAHLMYDCHLFRPCRGATVRAVVSDWQQEHDEPDERYGPPTLCPIIVLDGTRELRRVGPMVHATYKSFDSSEAAARQRDALRQWIRECEADPDIPRLLNDLSAR